MDFEKEYKDGLVWVTREDGKPIGIYRTWEEADRRVEEEMAKENCTYPNCKCIVSTSTSNPQPVCPKGLN